MRKHVIVSGSVQGVGFRNAANKKAKEMNLTGWVQNKADGTVELEVEGQEEKLQYYLKQIEDGLNKYIKVERMDVENKEDYGYDTFQTK